MFEVTLLLCMRRGGSELLLGELQRGPGKGKLNGPGGKREEGESLTTCAINELFQETSLRAKEKDLEKVAFLNFFFEDELVFACHVYLLQDWEGEPVDSGEMKNFTWYPTANLPYENMWLADREWMPMIFGGLKIQAPVYYNKDGTEMQPFKPEFVDSLPS